MLTWKSRYASPGIAFCAAANATGKWSTFFCESVMPSTTSTPGISRRRRNVSICRCQPPSMPRISSFICSSPSVETVMMSFSGLRAMIARVFSTILSDRYPLVGKCNSSRSGQLSSTA